VERASSRLNLGGGGGGDGDLDVGALGSSVVVVVVGLGQHASPPSSSTFCLDSSVGVEGAHVFELVRASINRSHRLSLSKQSSYDTPKPTNSDLISDTLIFDGFSRSVLLLAAVDDDGSSLLLLLSILEQLSYVSSSSEEVVEDMRVLPVPSLPAKRMVSFHPDDGEDDEDRRKKMLR